MDRPIRHILALGLAVTLFSVPAIAQAAGDVQISLKAQRVAVERGHEVRVSADQAKPGDVIEYDATYVNTGSAPVQGVLATLPVPAGLEYLPKTAAPARLEASLDGQTYAPVPLTRKVKRADGREETREVPAAEYRSLRWTIGALAAKQSVRVVARMRVSPLETVAAAR
jgi:uncharacterized repeat protein (TIGR01451 family)